MSHRNARLTPHGRLLIVQRYQANWKQAHIASAMGVSRKCVKTWIDRFEADPMGSLHMPLLGSEVMDQAADATLRDWITNIQ